MIHNVIDSIISPQTTRQPIPREVLQATAILGYSGGNSWPTWNPYRAARPDLDRKHWVVPVTLSCTAFGHVYDIEKGGGKNENIGIFMHNARNVWKTPAIWGLPWLYTFASNGAAMLAAARRFGYVQGRDFYYLAAHPNSKFGEHICHPELCGFPRSDGTQHLFAGAFDASVLNDYMLRGAAPPPPPKRASGTFNFKGSYNHDARTDHLVGEPGEVKAWGDINETIWLKVGLNVGPKPGTGGWVDGGVIGATPR